MKNKNTKNHFPYEKHTPLEKIEYRTCFILQVHECVCYLLYLSSNRTIEKKLNNTYFILKKCMYVLKKQIYYNFLFREKS